MSDILTPLASITIPDKAEMSTGAKAALAMVESWEVTDETTYELAGSELREIKAKLKALEERRTSMTVPLNGVLKSINALFKDPATVLEKAESIIKGKMIAYRTKAEREAQEAAKVAADLAAKAEAAAAPEEAAEAAVVAAMAAPAPAPVVKITGVSKVSTKLKARVADKAAFLSAVAQVPAYHNLVDVNESALNRLASALGSGLQIPGIELYEEKSISARAA